MNKPSLPSTLQRVLAEFDEKFIVDNLTHGIHDLESLRAFISQALTESLKEAFAAIDVRSGIIDEFLRATPDWLASLQNWDDQKQGCKMCGARYDKIKELTAALEAIEARKAENEN